MATTTPVRPTRKKQFYPVSSTSLGLGLVGWWTMDFDSYPFGSTILMEQSSSLFGGSNMNATQINAPVRVSGIVPGIPKGGCWTGGGGGMNCAAGSFSVPARQWPQVAFTCAAWINTTSTGTQAIVTAYQTNAYMQFFILSPGALFSRIQQTKDTIFIQRNSNNNIILANLWQHVAMVWSGGTTDAAITSFVNGVRVDTTNAGSGAFTNAYNGSDVTLEIGSQQGGTNLEGVIDDVRIYNRALSPAEILMLAAEPYQTIPGFDPLGLMGSAQAQTFLAAWALGRNVAIEGIAT